MSKNKERAEKICLNCNTELYDRYCHKCGQENTEPKHSVWHLVTHFFYDITHFDGKFFGTLKYLIRKPGFLSSEYIKGRRNSYLNPVRMYVFTSALFFLVFFSMFTVKQTNFGGSALDFDKDLMDRMRREAYKGAETRADSLEIDSALNKLGKVVIAESDTNTRKDTNTKKVTGKVETKSGWKISGWTPIKDMTVAQYDSIQRGLPADERDNWLTRKLKRQNIVLQDRYKGKENQFWTDLVNKFIHTFPYLLFISLPLYALYLKLLYVRRKQFWYVDHGIFLIHLYIFSFLLLLVIFLLERIKNSYDVDWLIWIQLVLMFYGIYYAFRSMRNFYKQGWFKTFLKFSLLNFLALISIIFLFSFFFVLSVFQL